MDWHYLAIAHSIQASRLVAHNRHYSLSQHPFGWSLYFRTSRAAMNSFRNTFKRQLPTSVIASSAAATCLFYASSNENADSFQNDGPSRSAIWNLSSVASSMTNTMTTDCLAMSDLKNMFKTTTATQKEERPHLLFLGTGSSTGCPKPLCAMSLKDSRSSISSSSSSSRFEKPDPTTCKTSHLALAGGDPKTNRDYRNNPCLLIHHYDEETKTYKNIIIDVGKTFRETALRWFPIHGVKSLDAIILTHHHMDAAAGLDDVRGFQGRKRTSDGGYLQQSMSLYLSDFCHLNLSSQFPWLLPKKSHVMPQQDKNRPTVKRHVASFDVTIFQDYKYEVLDGGFRFAPLPVWHGDDLISHGFAFSLHPGPSSASSRPLNVVYLSDISRMVPETLEYIQSKLPPTDILIVDSLLWEKEHAVHFSMEQAIDLAKTLKPRVRTYLIGMSCDNFLPHDQMNAYLKEKYGTSADGSEGAIVMAHDGLVVELPPKK